MSSAQGSDYSLDIKTCGTLSIVNIEEGRKMPIRTNMPGKDRDRDAITSNDKELRREGNGEQDEFRAGEGNCR